MKQRRGAAESAGLQVCAAVRPCLPCYRQPAVVIPDVVVAIGSFAVACPTVASATIPDSVVTINSSAFAGCTALTALSIPASVRLVKGIA